MSYMNKVRVMEPIPMSETYIVEQWAHAEPSDERYFHEAWFYPSRCGSLMASYLHVLVMLRDMPVDGRAMLEASEDGEIWVDITKSGALIAWTPLHGVDFPGSSIYERALFGGIPNPIEPMIGSVGHDVMAKGEYMFDSVRYKLIRIRTVLPTPGKMHIDVARAAESAIFWRILREKCRPTR